MNRLLITGAAGKLGRLARQHLAGFANILRLSDQVDVGPASSHEEIVVCDLGDTDAVNALVKDCDGIVHLGGISVEDSFDKILIANIQGVYNLYEAVRNVNPCRIFLASSNHVTGYHRRDQVLDAHSTTRPDGLYGVSKCFAANMVSLYHDKFGIETAVIRIGACYP